MCAMFPKVQVKDCQACTLRNTALIMLALVIVVIMLQILIFVVHGEIVSMKVMSANADPYVHSLH